MSNNALCLDAPPSLFDELPGILATSDLKTSETRRETRTTEVRRFEAAEFEVSDETSRIDIWIERRLGNKTMFVMIVPDRIQSGAQHSELTERVLDLLIQHGAWQPTDNDQ